MSGTVIELSAMFVAKMTCQNQSVNQSANQQINQSIKLLLPASILQLTCCLKGK